jgi:hypothetical protein
MKSESLFRLSGWSCVVGGTALIADVAARGAAGGLRRFGLRPRLARHGGR